MESPESAYSRDEGFLSFSTPEILNHPHCVVLPQKKNMGFLLSVYLEREKSFSRRSKNLKM